VSDDGRPHFPNDVRDLPPELARIAVFAVALGPAEDKREAAEKTVAGCEADRCAIKENGASVISGTEAKTTGYPTQPSKVSEESASTMAFSERLRPNDGRTQSSAARLDDGLPAARPRPRRRAARAAHGRSHTHPRHDTRRSGRPADGWAYGNAMSVHKAQGSQFEHVSLVTMKGRHGSRKSVYTAASRARKHLTIIGDGLELEESANRPDAPRRTLLSLDDRL
jgi:hypothetical protein